MLTEVLFHDRGRLNGDVFEMGDHKLCNISREVLASKARRSGARFFRGGAFKPRTSPYAFQGLGEKGLELMKDAAEKYQLFTVSEVMDPSIDETTHRGALPPSCLISSELRFCGTAELGPSKCMRFRYSSIFFLKRLRD